VGGGVGSVRESVLRAMQQATLTLFHRTSKTLCKKQKKQTPMPPAKDAKASAAALRSPGISPRREAAASIVAAAALLVTCVLAVSARLASIIKYESVIHEFDPYFNYRAFFLVARERRVHSASDQLCCGWAGRGQHARVSFLFHQALRVFFFSMPPLSLAHAPVLPPSLQASPNSWLTMTCTACGTGSTTARGTRAGGSRRGTKEGGDEPTSKHGDLGAIFFVTAPLAHT